MGVWKPQKSDASDTMNYEFYSLVSHMLFGLQQITHKTS